MSIPGKVYSFNVVVENDLSKGCTVYTYPQTK